MTTLAFVDTETTGLDPDRHEVWEVGLILRRDDQSEQEHRWLLPVDLKQVDSFALEIGRFEERYDLSLIVYDLAEWAAEFAQLTAGAHLVGAVVSFDEERLRRLCQRFGAEPSWHYHLVDVEALVAGRFGVAPPWKSDDLATAVGVTLDVHDRHTALGDARWARDLYDAAMAQ